MAESGKAARRGLQSCGAGGRRHRGGAGVLRPALRLRVARQERHHGLHRSGRPVHRPAERAQAGARRWPPFRSRGRRQGGGARALQAAGVAMLDGPFPRFSRSVGQSRRDRRLRQYPVHQGAECAARHGPDTLGLAKNESAKKELAQKGHGDQVGYLDLPTSDSEGRQARHKKPLPRPWCLLMPAGRHGALEVRVTSIEHSNSVDRPQDLARVHDVVGIERLLDRAHQRHRLAVLLVRGT